MPSHKPIPRIRVDLLDSPLRNLSPSSTLDIRDLLSQVKLFPKLLAEDLAFGDGADNALYMEDGCLQDVPPFPMGCQPPLFILHSHRTRLPFPIRPEAFELGDFCWDEDACPLLTIPTIPRMKLMIKEQLYVRKWVDTLTSDNPPKHIPWTCEKPAIERKWISEGSIFPAAVTKSSIEERGAIKERLRVTDTNRLLARVTDQVTHSEELCAVPEASAPMHLSTESQTSASHVPLKSADVDSGILRGESKTSQIPCRIIRTSQAPSPPTPDPPVRSISTTPDVPLAARRGKSLSGLKLQGSIIEQLEYPDIPTAFRGSPGVWSTRFDTFPNPFFTDHQSMLLNLKSRCAALGSGVLTYIHEPLPPRTEMTSSSVDEWMFTRGLATFDNNSLGSIESHAPRQIIADTNGFLPDGFSTPAKGPSFAARLGFVPRIHSTPASRSPINRSSDPPGVPLPPRPALVSPSTPPHVRGILKKVKSVRFEDMITKESQNHISSVVPSQAPPECPSAPASIISSERPCTPMPNTTKSTSGPSPVEDLPALGRNIQKRPTPKSRLPPKRTKANGKPELIRSNLNAGKTSEFSKPALAAISAGRPCRVAHVKENANPAVLQTQAKQKGLSIIEIDVRRGIEGTTKSRLSTPLRNIFRFR